MDYWFSLLVFLPFAFYQLGFGTIQWDEMPHLNGALMLTRGQTYDYISTYGFYPPVYDIVSMGYFQIFGVNVVAGRLVALTFALLAIIALFEFTKRTYGIKNALVASVLLGTMPGFFWLSRISMLETMLIFFFTLLMFAFFWLITKGGNKALLLSGLVLGIGILAKYQLIVAAIAMFLSILFLCRQKLKITLAKFLVILVIVVLVVTPWVLIVYQQAGPVKFESSLSAVQDGGQARSVYSTRFFTPVYYLIEMTWPFNQAPTHPIALPIFTLGLCGLALFAYRRKKQDLFLLTWFIVIYVFFTFFVGNRQWRYVDTLFPILAISAASFLMFMYGRIRTWKPKPIDISGNRLKKFARWFLHCHYRANACLQ